LTQSWLSDSTKDFGQQPSTTITVSLISTNPFYYTYATDISAKLQSESDADTVLNAIAAGKAPAALVGSCASELTAVQTAIDGMTKPITKLGSAPTSISVQTSISEWMKDVDGPYEKLHEDNTCSNGIEATQKAKVEAAHSDLFPSSGVTSSVARACSH
jgi:hypothetical protein